MSQTGTPDTGSARQPERTRLSASHRHVSKRQIISQAVETERRERDDAAVIRLRQNLALLLLELSESREPGQTQRFMVSGDGYKVYRIGIGGEAEMLLAIRERKDETQVRYVYFDGSGKEPKAREFHFRHSRATAIGGRTHAAEAGGDFGSADTIRTPVFPG